LLGKKHEPEKLRKGREKYHKELGERYLKRIEDAIERIHKKGEKETAQKIEEETGISHPTVLRYLRLIREKKKPTQQELESLLQTWFSDYKGLASRLDPKMKELSEKQKKGNFISIVKDFGRFIFKHKCSAWDLWARLDKLKPNLEKDMRAIENSVKIKVKANKIPLEFESVFSDSEIKNPLLERLFLLYYSHNFYENPAKAKATITISFDPLEGTKEALKERIALAEHTIVYGKFATIKPPERILEKFHGLMYQLIEDHAEYYRLQAIEKGTFEKTDFEDYMKKTVLIEIKNRLLKKLEGKLVEKPPERLQYLSYWEKPSKYHWDFKKYKTFLTTLLDAYPFDQFLLNQLYLEEIKQKSKNPEAVALRRFYSLLFNQKT
jgi:hypothetical protein